MEKDTADYWLTKTTIPWEVKSCQLIEAVTKRFIYLFIDKKVAGGKTSTNIDKLASKLNSMTNVMTSYYYVEFTHL